MIRENTNNRECFRVKPDTVRFALSPAWQAASDVDPNIPDPSKIAVEEVGRGVTVIKGKYRYVQAAFLGDDEIMEIAEANSAQTRQFYDWRKQAKNLDINALIAELDSNAMDDLMERGRLGVRAGAERTGRVGGCATEADPDSTEAGRSPAEAANTADPGPVCYAGAGACGRMETGAERPLDGLSAPRQLKR